MASKFCTHCHHSYPAHLKVCPQCHTPAVAHDMGTISEEEILEVFGEDGEVEEVSEDSLIIEDGGDEALTLAEEVHGEDNVEQATEIVEIVEEEFPPAPGRQPVGTETVKLEKGLVPQPPPEEEEETLLMKPGEWPPHKPEPAKEQSAKPPALEATTPRSKIAPPTQLGARQGAMTMLADSEGALNIPGSELSETASTQARHSASTEPKAPGAGTHEQNPFPNLSLDETGASLPHGEDAGAARFAEVPKKSTDTHDASEIDLLEELLTEGPSSLDLNHKVVEPNSGVDVIAEELESRTELGGVEPHPEGRGAVGGTVEEIDEATVDLGGKAATPAKGLIDFGVGEVGTHRPKAEEIAEVGAADLLVDEEEATEVGAADLWVGPGAAPVTIDEPAGLASAGSIVEEEAAGVLEEPVAAKGKVAAARKKPARKDALVEGEGGVAQPIKRDRPFRPRYGRRWVGGMLVGILLTAAAYAGVWFFQPDLLKQIPRSPNATAERPKVVAAPETPTQAARAQLSKGEYKQAVETLANSNDPEDLATRGEARWLNYLQEQTTQNKALDKTAKEVELALKDLGEAKQDLLIQQIKATVEGREQQQKLAKKIDELEKGQKKAMDLLVAEKILPANDPALKDLPQAVGAAVKAQKAAQNGVKTLIDTLARNNLLANPQQFDLKDFDALAKDLAQAKTVVTILEKQLKAKPDLLPEQVQNLEKARQSLETSLALVDAKLQEAKVNKKGIEGVTDLVSARDKLQANLADLKKTAETAMKELNEGKPLPPGTDLSKQLIASAKIISEKAKSPLVSSLGQVVTSLNHLGAEGAYWLKGTVERGTAETQLKYYQMREPFVTTPDRHLDTWISLMQDRSSKNPLELIEATRDANWVLSPYSNTSPEARAKARYLEGLVNRNQGKFAEAKKVLQEATQQAAALAPPPAWVAKVNQALKELQDPAAYYLPLAQNQRAAGQLPQALLTLNTGLAAIPQAPNLLALRGQVRLELARKQGTIDPAAAKDIRQDAEAAKGDPGTKANAFFTLGQLDEALGDMTKAETNYREAIKSAAGNPAEANQYRLALNRLLLRARSAVPAQQPGFAPGEQLAVLPFQPRGVIQATPPLTVWLVLGYQEAQDDPRAKEKDQVEKWIEDARGSVKAEEPQCAVKLKKWLDEAEINLQMRNAPAEIRGQGFMLLGRVLSETGKRTDGLKAYLSGLKLFHPEAELDQLNKLVEKHPAFQIPEALTQPNPARAEAHFGQGVHLYFEGKYPNAEGEFRRALGYNRSDARYLYYLGLAQLAQKTKKKQEEAEFNFEQATRLEIQNLPSTEEVNASLERIQGRLRQILNNYRQKAAQAGNQ